MSKNIYITTMYSEDVSEVELINETDSHYIIQSKKGGMKIEPFSKNSCTANVFDTFQEAKDHIIERAENRVKAVKRSLVAAEKNLGRARSMLGAL